MVMAFVFSLVGCFFFSSTEGTWLLFCWITHVGYVLQESFWDWATVEGRTVSDTKIQNYKNSNHFQEDFELVFRWFFSFFLLLLLLLYCIWLWTGPRSFQHGTRALGGCYERKKNGSQLLRYYAFMLFSMIVCSMIILRLFGSYSPFVYYLLCCSFG